MVLGDGEEERMRMRMREEGKRRLQFRELISWTLCSPPAGVREGKTEGVAQKTFQKYSNWLKELGQRLGHVWLQTKLAPRGRKGLMFYDWGPTARYE
jgi:hypothetical protein